MAKQYSTTNGVLRIPGAYTAYTVQTSPGGLATTGVLMLVGEAKGGAHWSLEEDLEVSSSFGPDQLAEVTAKFQGGPLVDAFRGAVNASNDPDIVGSFNRAILVKTNTGTKATAALQVLGGGSYVTVYDRNYGVNGNQTQFAVAQSQAEVAPSTGSFTYIPAVGTVNIDIRASGSAINTVNVVANRAPNLFVTDVNGSSNADATGGANRNMLTVSGTLAVAIVSGNTITLTRSVAWAVTPSIGDTLIIPSTAPAGLRDPTGGASDENVGAYVITSATSTVITATKLSDAGRSGAVAGTITPPAATVAPVTVAAVTDAAAYAPVTITYPTGAPIANGFGKSLEIGESASPGSDLLERTAYVLGTVTPVSWVSKSAAPAMLVSSAETEMTITASRSFDNASESFTEGGEIALRIGYTGGAATVSITDTLLTTSTGLSLPLANYTTIQALADYISTQAGYTASVGTAALGFLPPQALDRVSSLGVSSNFGTIQPARIKIDAYRMFNAVNEGSRLIQFNDPAERADVGLPTVTSATFLSGGTQGGTSNADVSAAIAALELVDGNFLIPLFSRDASDDIVDGDTDASSTYTIASINAAAKAHVLAMSTFKRRKNRQAISSIQSTFAAQQTASANTASFRVGMTFQNVKDLNADSEIITFQPWMAAIKAASMQAAGFYRSITNKKVQVSGVTQAAGDFNPKNDSQLENALIAGLMPLRKSRTGGFEWVSDQTTYGQDDNFVFNSMQAVYAADTISLTTGQRMEQAFVGQSVADISAQVALTALDQIMADFLRLKLIAPSDDALKGYKNAKIRIVGNVMLVSVEIKLATSLDFIVIDFLVSPVQQTATA